MSLNKALFKFKKSFSLSFTLTFCFLIFIKLHFIYGGQKEGKNSPSCAKVITESTSLKQRNMTWIHEHKNWPQLSWDEVTITSKLDTVHRIRSRIFESLKKLGFRLPVTTPFDTRDLPGLILLDTLTNETVKSFAIEGEHLNINEVRSSIAYQLGIETNDLNSRKSYKMDSLISMILDATQNYKKPLTKNRLFAWHASLFPTGYSNLMKISVGRWRKGDMQVISGPIGHERVHFEAPKKIGLKKR